MFSPFSTFSIYSCMYFITTNIWKKNKELTLSTQLQFIPFVNYLVTMLTTTECIQKSGIYCVIQKSSIFTMFKYVYNYPSKFTCQGTSTLPFFIAIQYRCTENINATVMTFTCSNTFTLLQALSFNFFFLAVPIFYIFYFNQMYLCMYVRLKYFCLSKK